MRFPFWLCGLVVPLVGACLGPGGEGEGTPTPRYDAGQNDFDAGPISAGPWSSFIVVDQFGYRTDAEKIAVVRDPEWGRDADQAFTPGTTYALVDVATGEYALTGEALSYKSGAVDDSSGDRTYWFDFSSVTTPGEYYVLDVDNAEQSATFRIADDIYREILRQALRTFFYQRAGFAKPAEFAGDVWADQASHIRPQQDMNCRQYDAKDDPATERDLHGGWYDAGDYNKYTNWTSDYVIELLRAYRQSPYAFSDDYGIPESGNGVPDVIDEVRWGMDWLVRMQNEDGSELSIVGLASGTPPSTASGPSYYGTASTSATLSAAGAFAYGAIVLRDYDPAYADDLQSRALSAWAWADANPSVTFYNNSGNRTAGSTGLGAGQQEVGMKSRFQKKLAAALYLFEATGDTAYRDFFDTQYDGLDAIANAEENEFQIDQVEVLLEYATLADATPDVALAIQDSLRESLRTGILERHRSLDDPYMAPISSYTWGSNATKSRAGNLLYTIVGYGLDADLSEEAGRYAERYLHYIHGVNPFAEVYLSNMAVSGAENSVKTFFHSWYADNSKWDELGKSKYGPAPGFLVGGPNPSYHLNSCCPDNCGGGSCDATIVEPLMGQPAQKSYLDFNDSWPIDSWQVTENSDGYQAAYIRLLSKFVR